MDSRKYVGVLSWVSVVTLVGCHDRSTAEDGIEVLMSGCRWVEVQTCELTPTGQIAFWLPARLHASVEVFVDKEQVVPQIRGVLGGFRYSVVVPDKARFFQLEVSTFDGNRTVRARIRRPAETAVQVAARSARRRGDFETAELLLNRAIGTSSLDVYPQLLSQLARLEFAAGRPSASLATFDVAIGTDQRLQRWSSAVRNSLTSVYVLIYGVRDFVLARRRLSSLSVDALDGENQILLASRRGMLAVESFDYQTAKIQLRTARMLALKLGRPDLASSAYQQEAFVAMRSGQFDQARGILQKAKAVSAADPCVQGGLLANIAWVDILVMEGDGPREPTAAVDLLQKSVDRYTEACPRRTFIANALVDLAVAHHHDKNLALARAALEASYRHLPKAEPTVESWRMEVRARLALGEGQPRRALAIYLTIADYAVQHDLAGALLRAALGQATCLMALDDASGALSALHDAWAHVVTLASAVPIGDGRIAFHTYHQRVAARLIEGLLAAGRIEEAATTARASRAVLMRALSRLARFQTKQPNERKRRDRALSAFLKARQALEQERVEIRRLPVRASIEAEHRWQKKVDALEGTLHSMLRVSSDRRAADERLGFRKPLDDELMLIYHPYARGIYAFAWSAGALDVAQLGHVDDTLAEPQRLLAPFAPQIRAADRISIYAYGRLNSVDFHAVPFDGKALLAHARVVYPVDVARDGDPFVSSASRAALVVAPSPEQLPGSVREVRVAATQLAKQSWTVSELSGPAVRLDELARRVSQAPIGLFHFAGHAGFSGQDGWESSLLAGDLRFSVPQILALPGAPTWVVISACSGAEAPKESIAGLGVGQAFLLSGSRVVVSTTRPISDDLAERFAKAFYSSGPLLNPIESARTAQLAIARRYPESDWSSVRVLIH